MFVSKRAFRVVQEEVARLRSELLLAQRSVADHQRRASDLADAMLAARADAREVLRRAEDERSGIVARAREEASAVFKASDAQIAAAKAEIERLKQVQRDLSASIEQSVVALRSALTNTGAPSQRSDVQERQAARVTDDAVSQFRPQVPSAPAVRDPVQKVVERSRREWPPPPVPPVRMSWRSDPSRWEALRKSLLRPAPFAAVVSVLLVLAAGLWWSRAARGPESSDSSPAGSAAESANPGGGAGDGAVARRPGTPQQVGTPSRELRPRAVGVKLRAIRDVWVRVEVDTTSRVNRLVRGGEELTFGADREVAIRAGDAGALVVSVDGRRPAPLGPQGAVLTRRITAHGTRAGGTAAPEGVAETRRAPTLLVSDARRNVPTAPGPRNALSAPPESHPASLPQPRSSASPVAPPVSRAQIGAPADSGVPAPGAGGLSTDESDVLHAHEAYFDALARGDTSGMARLAGDGFTVTGAPATNASGVPFAISLSKASVDVRGVGAVVSGTGSQRITGADGQTSHQTLLFSEVWIKRGNQWQLTSLRFLSPGGAR
jgi:hypothetical protein